MNSTTGAGMSPFSVNEWHALDRIHVLPMKLICTAWPHASGGGTCGVGAGPETMGAMLGLMRSGSCAVVGVTTTPAGESAMRTAVVGMLAATAVRARLKYTETMVRRCIAASRGGWRYRVDIRLRERERERVGGERMRSE